MEEVFEKIVESICKKQNYEEMIANTVKGKVNNNIEETLGIISSNSKLEKTEKDQIYNKIFDFVKDMNNEVENKVKDIYRKGLKESITAMSIIFSKHKSVEDDEWEELEFDVRDFINTRLEKTNKLGKNAEHKSMIKDIKKYKEKIKDKENLEELENLYELLKDIENVKSYEQGFTDAINILTKFN